MAIARKIKRIFGRQLHRSPALHLAEVGEGPDCRRRHVDLSSSEALQVAPGCPLQGVVANLKQFQRFPQVGDHGNLLEEIGIQLEDLQFDCVRDVGERREIIVAQM